MMTPKHFLNGQFVEEAALMIPVRDLGFTRGYAIFDFLVTYGGRPFMLDRHVARLFHSAEAIGLLMPWSQAQVRAWVEQTLQVNAEIPGEKGVRMIVSGGASHSLVPQGEPTMIILADPRVFPRPEEYQNGIGIITVHHTRYTPDAKTNNYIEAVKQAQAARAIGATEPVYYNEHQVFEGAVSNVFVVAGGRVLTPKSNILTGVTRDVLLEVLSLDMPVVVEDFSIETLRAADEIFLTGSNKEVMPVTRIDGAPVGSGVVGAVAKEALKQFRAYVEQGAWDHS
ncbi:MAG: hypothetical protein RL141_609 [Candidatus Parcubacteria bacterium]|jgi:branched-chain amino acid aminotransferase